VNIAFQPDLRAHRGRLTSGAGERGQPVHAGAFLRERRVVLDAELLEHAPELLRILTHELFHFVWRRLDNATRRSWEQVLAAEGTARELGWSAEWRRRELTPGDMARRSKRWREYCCEAFADTAAWMFSAGAAHEEYTLERKHRARRRAWFRHLMKERKLPL